MFQGKSHNVTLLTGVLVEGTLLVRLFLVVHTDMWNQSVIVLIHHYSLIQWYRCCSWGRNLHFSLFIPCIGTERVGPLTSVFYLYHLLSVVVTERVISINLHHLHDWRFIIYLSFSCVLNFDYWKGNDVMLLYSLKYSDPNWLEGIDINNNDKLHKKEQYLALEDRRNISFFDDTCNNHPFFL